MQFFIGGAFFAGRIGALLVGRGRMGIAAVGTHRIRPRCFLWIIDLYIQTIAQEIYCFQFFYCKRIQNKLRHNRNIVHHLPFFQNSNLHMHFFEACRMIRFVVQLKYIF